MSNVTVVHTEDRAADSEGADLKPAEAGMWLIPGGHIKQAGSWATGKFSHCPSWLV